MDIPQRLMEAGFSRVLILDGPSCGQEAATVLLALWEYDAEEEPASGEGWIHPYYFASQQAYLAASALMKEAQRDGIPLALRDDIRVKPIFARLAGFSQGRNTLSYAEGMGSRFHVQILTINTPLPPTHCLEESPHPLHCGTCRRCLDACPTNALDEYGFYRERCLRNWMMSGQPIPEFIRGAMGTRLIGCDVCQRVCPHNPPPRAGTHQAIPLLSLLTCPKEASAALKPLIGTNLSIPNRVLSQACVMAGSTARLDLLPAVQALTTHASPTVREHAQWAVQRLQQCLKNAGLSSKDCVNPADS